jgi:hypothetical protein
MRRTLLVGGVLAVSAFLVVVLSNLFDLELDSVTLLGVALGAVVALDPDRSPWKRLGGFVAGIVVAWIGFFIRAALLPDTATGRALTVGLVILLCAVIAAASMERLPLWTLLVGAAALSGAYEYTYAAAPPEIASTSVTAVTSLLVASAVGFLVVALTTPRGDLPAPVRPDRTDRQDDDTNNTLDDMMEKSQ